MKGCSAPARAAWSLARGRRGATAPPSERSRAGATAEREGQGRPPAVLASLFLVPTPGRRRLPPFSPRHPRLATPAATGLSARRRDSPSLHDDAHDDQGVEILEELGYNGDQYRLDESQDQEADEGDDGDHDEDEQQVGQFRLCVFCKDVLFNSMM